MAITTFTGLNVQPETTNGTITNSNLHGFYLPDLTADQIAILETTPEMRDGFVSYVSGHLYNLLRTRINGNFFNISTNIGGASGDGLANSVAPLILPTGTALAVEVAGNQLPGFVYLDTTSSTYRGWDGNAWVAIS